MRTRPLYESFTLDGISSLNYGVRISDESSFSGAERDVDAIEVAGRNGYILFDNGRYKPIPLKFEGYIAEDFDTNVTSFRAFLQSRGDAFYRLETSYQADEYRMAKPTGSLEVETEDGGYSGNFEIYFTCQPERWLKSGETALVFTASGQEVTNPTIFPSKPLIRVYYDTTSDAEVTISGQVIKLASGAAEYIDIDSEAMDCFENGVNRNGLVTFNNGEFPLLASGANALTFGDGVTKVEITPRWWRL